MPIKGVLSKARVPIKIWSDLATVESSALNQLTNIANLPFVFKHVAVMPDVHLGKGATVGSVVATKGAICPAAVGVDIGCGMIAAQLNIQSSKVLDKLAALRHSIERAVPVGFESNRKITKSVDEWQGFQYMNDHPHHNAFGKAIAQMGSLGGGNHFIEICVEDQAFDKGPVIWVMLHSGSRNVGKTLAEIHMWNAKKLMKQMFINLTDPDLAYLSEETEEFKAYVKDVEWAQAYALENREEMMRRVLREISYLCNDQKPVEVNFQVNCHHNYISREHHFGENVLVTRKGAVRAREEDYGIIPGSMGTRSYIVKGKGNAESFCSCSHGAGRRMSRGEAKRVFTVEDLAAQTSGVECRKDAGVLDEIPGAYKAIEEVMANQSDLVEIVAELKQVLCIKG